MRRKIFLSMLMIALVAALVGGATFAYYTDQEVNNDNTFAAGTLDITLTDANIDNPYSGPMLSFDNIAPGFGLKPDGTVDKAGRKTLRINNVGTVATKFRIDIAKTLTATDPRYPDAGAALYDGPDAIMVDYVIDGTGHHTGTLKQFVEAIETYNATHNTFPLAPPAQQDPPQNSLWIEAIPYLPLTAGNATQGGKVELDITVYATQQINPAWDVTGTQNTY